MMEWYTLVSSGKPYYDSTDNFPDDWASKESRKDIKTLLDVPIFVDGNWWGVIGFDDCTRIKPWSQVEVHAMQIAAGLLGSLIKRQKADEEIKASEDKFQTTFHETPVPMVIGRISDRHILDVNLAFSTLTGYTREEAISRSGTELKLWANKTEQEAHHELIAKQGFLREYKAHIRKKTGDVAVVLLSVSSIKIKDDDCLLYTIYEITKLEQLLTELQDKNNELERFTYTVSHDLKAPLITIGGFAGLLARDVKSGNLDKANRSIDRILDAVSKMERLLNELLELSRIGRMINEPQEVPFEEIAKEAVGLTQGRLRASNIPVEIEAGLPNVKVDRARIVEVLQNLLDNAAKFMGEQKNPKIKIGMRKENERLVFFVQDNGIGIDPVYHERIFGLFNKLESNSEGTGVGLALVKRIIEFHSGKVWVESEGMNKGSMFCFTLPLV
ncbi:MAG: PAS domain S-box protein [Anaerolineales bacterium]|nr:PAS domain S-box protein [Anaerolineales bacterium]